MWVYEQSTGRMYHNGVLMFEDGWAGAVGYKNKPEYQCLKDKGPLPRGRYTINAPKTGVTGSYSLPLTPDSSNQMCNRNAFLIHGSNRKDPASSSTGCIILSLQQRKDIWKSNDYILEVR